MTASRGVLALNGQMMVMVGNIASIPRPVVQRSGYRPTPPGAYVGEPTVIVGNKGIRRDQYLANVVLVLRAPGRIAKHGDRGEQKSNQHGNDGHDHHQLNKGETPTRCSLYVTGRKHDGPPHERRMNASHHHRREPLKNTSMRV